MLPFFSSQTSLAPQVDAAAECSDPKEKTWSPSGVDEGAGWSKGRCQFTSTEVLLDLRTLGDFFCLAFLKDLLGASGGFRVRGS